ncbi:MAG TPA: 2-oxoacid:ferredoxin oxidoreductase subunit beta [Opitutaceae bacterium]|nr:2-oxoacid:ferredoxin oxidoreductase subunit beta [Opitutaceae bacterium]
MSTATSPAPAAPARAPLTRKALTADHPTWCPGCGDFAVLASFQRTLEKLQYPQESIVCFAGIGCSSRFPYFMNTHGGHYLHGRALPIAAGVSLSREDLHVFVFGGDGDGFSIGGNHLVHTARKNVNLTYIIMDNFVYGLTKKQTSPTSPVGFKSKTDPTGAVDQPINPMRTLINSGATFVARSHAAQVAHMTEMMERAARHDGFAVVEILSECVEFYPGAFDAGNPRKNGAFTLIQERKNDGSPEDAQRHDPTNEVEAFRLATLPWPGVFGVFYEVQRPTKNRLEAGLVTAARERSKGAGNLQLLQSTFARLR